MKLKKFSFSLVAILLLVGYGYFVSAAAPSGGYNPGQILDPDCAPGDVDCVVKLQISGGGSPAGSDTQIQYNNAGVFGANSDFTFDPATSVFTVTKSFPKTITIVQFEGSGLNDITTSGSFTGTKNTQYRIIIDSEGAPDTFSWEKDGLTQATNVPITGTAQLLDDGVSVIFGATTGHTIGDSSIFYGTAFLDTALSNAFDLSAIFGGGDASLNGQVIQDGTFLALSGLTQSPNNTGNGVNMINIVGDIATGSLTNFVISKNGFFTQSSDGLATSAYSVNPDGVYYGVTDGADDLSFQGEYKSFFLRNTISSVDYGISQESGAVTVGNLSGGNGTKITIDDIAQTINFNNNYSFPFADGTAGQVLGTDGLGQLGWVTVSGGSVSPISIGTSGNTLYSSGLSGTGQGDTSTGNNIFLGINAGNSATNASGSNFLGSSAGYSATSASGSNFLGLNAGQYATDASNSNFLGPNAGNGATSASGSNFLGSYAGNSATGAYNSNFLGLSAGNSATGAYGSNFLGQSAGNSATGAYGSNFFGSSAGQNATDASSSNFLGPNAGNGATSASNSNFLGTQAGSGATNAFFSNFLGLNAGKYATDASNSNFLGPNAGNGATSASNSIFIGKSAGNNDLVNNTGSLNDFSILIGPNTSTGNNGSGVGYSNSIALGGYATNTASNQFMIGSVTRPITSMVLTGDYSGGSCTFAVGGMSCSSDERLKTNIEDLQSSTLDTVINIRTVHYNWNGSSDGPKQVGFIAQDLQQYFPELVSMGQGGYLQVNYAQMTPILVQAIREMNLNITELANMERPNTWRDSLIAWFGNVENGITELFVGRAHVKELCIGDQNNETCLTKEQIDQLLQILPTEQYETTNPIIENTPPVGESVNETEIVDTQSVPAEEIVPENIDPTVETISEPITEPDTVIENNPTDTSEQ